MILNSGMQGNTSELVYDKVVSTSINAWYGHATRTTGGMGMFLGPGVWDIDFNLKEHSWTNYRAYYSPMVGLSGTTNGAILRAANETGVNAYKLWHSDQGYDNSGYSGLDYRTDSASSASRCRRNPTAQTSAGNTSLFPLERLEGVIEGSSAQYLRLYCDSTNYTTNVTILDGQVIARRRAFGEQMNY